MFDWLFILLSPPPALPKQDFVGVIAVDVAYAALPPDRAPTKPLVDTKDCKRCNGTGEIPTGDSNHPWTDCPDCEKKTGVATSEMVPGGTNPTMRLQVKPLPPVATPECDEDGCPIPATVSGTSKPAVTSRPTSTYRK